jgi:putative membrane protein
MNRLLTAVCCIAVASVPAFGQKATAKSNTTDQQFVGFAAQTDMVEANLGQMAQTNGSAQDVKDFGQTLTTDHTSDYQQLKAAASQPSLEVASSIDAEHNKAMIDPFAKLTGAAFDKKFAADMVAGHTKAIALYKKEAAQTQNPALKSYAEAALPVLQKHLDGAKKLGKSK